MALVALPSQFSHISQLPVSALFTADMQMQAAKRTAAAHLLRREYAIVRQALRALGLQVPRLRAADTLGGCRPYQALRRAAAHA